MMTETGRGSGVAPSYLLRFGGEEVMLSDFSLGLLSKTPLAGPVSAGQQLHDGWLVSMLELGSKHEAHDDVVKEENATSTSYKSVMVDEFLEAMNCGTSGGIGWCGASGARGTLTLSGIIIPQLHPWTFYHHQSLVSALSLNPNETLLPLPTTTTSV